MSDAPRSTASAMIECTSLTMGASALCPAVVGVSSISSSGSGSSTAMTVSSSRLSRAISALMSAGSAAAGLAVSPVIMEISSTVRTFVGSAIASNTDPSGMNATGTAW